MCLAQGPQRSDAGEARTRYPSVSSQVVSYKGKYVHEVLVNCLFKLAQEKVWLGELTVPQWP